MSTTTLDVLQGLKYQIGAKHAEAAEKANYHNERYLAFEATNNEILAERELGDMTRVMGKCNGFAEAYNLVSEAIDRVLNCSDPAPFGGFDPRDFDKNTHLYPKV